MTDEVFDLINNIDLIADEAMENREKGIRGAKVEILRKDGKVLEETVLIPKGDPENPLSRDDIIEKLRVCSEGLASEDTVMKLVRMIENIQGHRKFVNPIAKIGVDI